MIDTRNVLDGLQGIQIESRPPVPRSDVINSPEPTSTILGPSLGPSAARCTERMGTADGINRRKNV